MITLRAIALALVACGTVPTTHTAPKAEGPQYAPTSDSGRPNIVLILADDQEVASISVMPHLANLIANQGTMFSKYYFSQSQCCPSRTSMLRGQYPHNHLVNSNFWPTGGWKRVNQLGHESSTVATWLQAAGYVTSYIGKYLNEYHLAPVGHIPPGWSDWHAVSSAQSFGTTTYNYSLNENGVNVFYGTGAANFSTDVFAGKAVAFITAQAQDTAPFFLWVSPYGLAGGAPRHVGMFSTASLPITANFNEANVSDKPQWVKNNSLMTAPIITTLTSDYRKRLEALQSIDEMILAIVNALTATGQLDNTFIIYASDNGYHWGEHRLTRDPMSAYEEYIRGPFYVRGPDVPVGVTLDHLVLNNDFAPTFAAIGGATAPSFVDGRSLLPLLVTGAPPSTAWRQNLTVEFDWINAPISTKRPPRFFALRTPQYTYVEYANGERELYDNLVDPFQLTSVHLTADPTLLAALALQLAAVKTCAGAGCQAVEDVVVP